MPGGRPQGVGNPKQGFRCHSIASLFNPQKPREVLDLSLTASTQPTTQPTTVEAANGASGSGAQQPAVVRNVRLDPNDKGKRRLHPVDEAELAAAEPIEEEDQPSGRSRMDLSYNVIVLLSCFISCFSVSWHARLTTDLPVLILRF